METGVKPLGLARPSLAFSIDSVSFCIGAVAVLIALRFVAAAILPLFFGDEPYYWLWSRNLAWGYFDHPPAIAVLIRAGTALFGDTEFGVRVGGLVLSVPTTLCVWRTGTLLLGGTENGARTALFFNLTLMATTQSFLVSPDAPLLACSAGFIWALAELTVTRDGRWWLAAGLFGGLGTLSKYTMLCLAGSTVLWLVLAKDGRAWLKTPWPWLGGGLAAILFAPNVIWNFNHRGGALAFQFARLIEGDFHWKYLPRFLGEQIVLASPGIMILAMYGLWRAARSKDRIQVLMAALAWPVLIFFACYSLEGRVHRNWIDIIYPVLAVAAADAFRRQEGPRHIRLAAVPVAALLLIVPYCQLFFRVIPVERLYPLNQELASRMKTVVAPVADAVLLTGARGIVTTNFETTSWLKFYLPSSVPIIQINEEFRYPYAPRATVSDLTGTLLHVRITLIPNQLALLKDQFSEIEPLDGNRQCDGPGRQPFCMYRLSGFHGELSGRIP